MAEAWMNEISPFVRMVKVVKSVSLAGEWIDFDHVLTYIKQGAAEFVLNGIKYEVQEGDMIVMPPLMPHIIRTTSAEPLIQYIMHFDLFYDEERSGWKTGQISEVMRHVPDREKALADIRPLVRLRTAERMELTRAFLLLHKAFMDNRPRFGLLGKATCAELLYLFLEGQEEVGAQSGGHVGKLAKGWGIIEKAIAFMNERYADSALDNAAIGRHAGVTPNHLSFLFKEQLNLSIHKYLTHIRIEKAKRKIVEGGKTWTAIAEETGFSSIHLFSRSFKAAVGITPSEYYAAHSNRPIVEIDK